MYSMFIGICILWTFLLHQHFVLCVYAIYTFNHKMSVKIMMQVLPIYQDVQKYSSVIITLDNSTRLYYMIWSAWPRLDHPASQCKAREHLQLLPRCTMAQYSVP